MSILPQLERDLCNAARERLPATGEPSPEVGQATPPARSRGLRGRLGGAASVLPIVGAIIVTVAVVVAVAMVAHPRLSGHGRGPSGTQAPVTAGSVKATRQQLIQMLGVLRRPQTKADLAPTFVHGGLLTMPAGSARRLGYPKLDRGLLRVVKIPAWHAKVGIEPATWQPSPSSPHRSEGIALELWIGSKPTIPPSSDVGTGPRPTSIDAFRAHGLALAGIVRGKNLMDGVTLVPDGVARVTLRPIRLGKVPVRVDPSRFGATTATVHANVAAFQLPVPTLVNRKMLSGVSTFGTSAVAQATWFDASGNVIKHTTTNLDVFIRFHGHRPSGAQPSSNAVIKDCLAHGKLTRSYTHQQLRRALAAMPASVKKYTNCTSVINQAL